MHIISERSRIETGQKCTRKRYWEYHYRGRGVRRAASIPPAWELETGSWIHSGIEWIMNGMDAAAAANKAADEYALWIARLLRPIEDIATRGLYEWEGQQQVDLVLALVYGYGVYRLPLYLAQYEPVADGVEKEEQLTFDIGSDDQVTLLTRTDLLSKVRGIEPPRYILHNYKSVSRADQKWRQMFRYDMQTLTEAAAVENRIGEQVAGVVIEGLVKGKKSEYPEGSGKWQHSSPLIYCWYKDGEPPMVPPDYRPRYQWTCSEPHSTGGRGRNSECPGGRLHRLSGYRKERIQSVYPGGIIAWIDYLLVNDRAVIEEQFITLEPIMRSPWEVERWKRQVLARELDYSRATAAIEQQERMAAVTSGDAKADAVATYHALMDYHFPMISGHGNCLQPGECPFIHVCWGAESIDDSSLFVAREANHPAEGEIMGWNRENRENGGANAAD